ARAPLGPPQAPLARGHVLRRDRGIDGRPHAPHTPPLHRVDASGGRAPVTHPAAPRGQRAAPGRERPRRERRRDLRRHAGGGVAEVRFTTPDPSLSAFLAAAHTQAYLEANEEARRANDVTAQEFLGRQLDESRQQVERGEAALSRFAAEHPNVAVNEEQKTVA